MNIGQLIITGLLTGSMYSLLALGFVLIYKCTGVLNLAVGEFALFGALIVGTLLSDLGLPVALAIPLTLILGLGLSWLVERVGMRRLIGEEPLSMIIMTLAIGSLLFGLMQTIWGGAALRGVKLFSQAPLVLGSLLLPQESVFGFALSIVAVCLFLAYFQFGRGGLLMRATAEDHQVVQSLGVDIRSIFSRSWLLGGLILVLAGVVLGGATGTAWWGISDLALKGLPIALVGGLQSIPGAIVAGLLVGVLESLSGAYIDPLLVTGWFMGGGFKDVFPYGLMIIILLIRPYGIFGLKRIERV